jgi:hypothetical protein
LRLLGTDPRIDGMKRPTAIPGTTLHRLHSAEPWTAYLALSRLGGAASAPAARPEEASRLEKARKASVASPLVRGLVEELDAWPGKAISSHKSAEQLFHKLSLAAELGLRRGDPGADAIAAKAMKHRSAEGPFGLQMNIGAVKGPAAGAARGGSGENLWAWALCDAPVVLRALARIGWADAPAFVESVDYLAGLERAEGGWPCAVSKSLGSFRGPGKKGDPCPYATLVMLELLLDLPSPRPGPAVERAAECLLGLWERSRVDHPYIFYMGDDFRKLKAPLIWYDLLHVLEALTRVPGIEKDKRLAEMLDLLEAKASAELLFTPESVYQTWKGCDFGQKKEPSLFLSAIALGILARTGRIAAT